MWPLVCTRVRLVSQWGSDHVTQVPSAVTDAVKLAKTAQILHYVKENQLLTAVCLFVLWQAGAFIAAASQVQGVVC